MQLFCMSATLVLSQVSASVFIQQVHKPFPYLPSTHNWKGDLLPLNFSEFCRIPDAFIRDQDNQSGNNTLKSLICFYSYMKPNPEFGKRKTCLQILVNIFEKGYSLTSAK